MPPDSSGGICIFEINLLVLFSLQQMKLFAIAYPLPELTAPYS
jgi:hypothetical protein